MSGMVMLAKNTNNASGHRLASISSTMPPIMVYGVAEPSSVMDITGNTLAGTYKTAAAIINAVLWPILPALRKDNGVRQRLQRSPWPARFTRSQRWQPISNGFADETGSRWGGDG